MDEVVSADGQGVSVAGRHPHREAGVGGLDARSDGRGTSVHGVEPEGLHVVDEPRRASDTRDEGKEVVGGIERIGDFGQGALHGIEDGVVAATGAPAYLLIAFEIRGGVFVVCHGVISSVRIRIFFELDHREGLAFALVVLLVMELLEVLAEVVCELAFVEFADDDAAEAGEDFAHAAGQGVDVVEVAERDLVTFAPHLVDGVLEVSAGAAPSYDEEFTLFVAPNRLCRNILDDAGDLLGACADHLLVVGRIVGDAALDGILFETADAVFQPGFSGECPSACELLVADIGHESAFGGLVDDRRADRRVILHRGDAPRLGAVGDEAVGEQHHGGHVLHGEAPGLEGVVEAVAGRRGGQNDHRTLSVSAVEGLCEVALFGFGRQTRRGAAALYVDDD